MKLTAEQKLTRAERSFLELALRSPTGNPWPRISISQRGGGAKARLGERLKSRGLLGPDNCITDAGRRALAEGGGDG